MHPHNQSPSSSSQYLYGSNSSISLPHYQSNPDFPPSLSQLLLGGLGNEQQEVAQTSLLYGALDNNDGFHGSSSNNNRPNSSCSQILMPSSSPTSCVTSLSSNSLLNFSNSQADGRNQHQENSSHECNSSSSGGVPKKPKIQHSSPQPVLKVRKEKLGDRITALHQLVSPFGKTDTASVLSEVIGYIRFLQAQIEVVSSPYLGNVSGGGMAPQHQQQCEPQQDRPKGLKSRGLCLVPVSCIQHFRSDNGAQLLDSAEELASWNDTSNINSSHFIN